MDSTELQPSVTYSSHINNNTVVGYIIYKKYLCIEWPILLPAKLINLSLCHLTNGRQSYFRL